MKTISYSGMFRCRLPFLFLLKDGLNHDLLIYKVLVMKIPNEWKVFQTNKGVAIVVIFRMLQQVKVSGSG